MNANKIFLTFDDGPSNITNDVLDLLLQYNVHAEFFLLAENCLKYPDIIKREIREGHQLSIHGYNHKSFSKMTHWETQEQLGKAMQILNTMGVEPKHWRPPYGTVSLAGFNFFNNRAIKLCLWDVMEEDWKGRVRGKTGRIIDATRDKSAIITMHDGFKDKDHHGSTLEILKIILPVLKSTHEFCLL